MKLSVAFADNIQKDSPLRATPDKFYYTKSISTFNSSAGLETR